MTRLLSLFGSWFSSVLKISSTELTSSFKKFEAEVLILSAKASCCMVVCWQLESHRSYSDDAKKKKMAQRISMLEHISIFKHENY